MISIIEALIPFILQLLNSWLQKSAANAETKKAYADFLIAIQKDSSNSQNLRDSADSQRARIQAALDAQK